jgi:hypothetical protein
MKKDVEKQVFYMGRWVDKEHFAVFVYNSTGEKLVKNYDEFVNLISSGVWFACKDDLAKKQAQDLQPDNIVSMKTKRGKDVGTSNIG